MCPNWCDNSLVIEGDAEILKDLVKKAEGSSPWAKTSEDKKENFSLLQFHKLVPVPDTVIKRGYSEAGYDWQIKFWGCKWSASDASIHEDYENGIVSYYFNTPWSPPEQWVLRVSESYPKLKFTLSYSEPGMGFSGELICQDGVKTTDIYREDKEYDDWYKEVDPEGYAECHSED